MQRSWKSTIQFAIAVVATVQSLASAEATDYFLTIGGGDKPSGNQVSLEKNSLFFQRLLSTQRPDSPRHDIFFADGDAPARDLQFSNPDAVPRANRLMAELFGKTEGLALEYRNHAIPNLRGGSSEANINRWFEQVGSKMRRGDRLILYATAHGGKSSDRKRRPYNTKLYLWNRESITVRELADRISDLPDGVAVVLVMVQCYSGGFASTIFEDGDQEKGPVDRDLCGFFATVHDRPAAGCTADINEEDYQEYSTFFWAGIGRETRIGETIEPPDYDHDGQTTFDEAHAYVILTSNTIDIPTKTSGMFLRAYSKQEKSAEHPGLIGLGTPFEQLLVHATPAEVATLTGLSAELQLTQANRYEAARKLAKQIERERRRQYGEVKRLRERRKKRTDAIVRDLKRRWPELTNTLSATATSLLTRRAAEFEDAVVSHPDYSKYQSIGEQIDSLEAERFRLRKRWTKCRRLERSLQNVVLAHNLPFVADEKTVARFERLWKLEASTLAPY